MLKQLTERPATDTAHIKHPTRKRLCRLCSSARAPIRSAEATVRHYRMTRRGKCAGRVPAGAACGLAAGGMAAAVKLGNF